MMGRLVQALSQVWRTLELDFVSGGTDAILRAASATVRS